MSEAYGVGKLLGDVKTGKENWTRKTSDDDTHFTPVKRNGGGGGAQLSRESVQMVMQL